MSKQDAYERVTDAILERLDAGTVPWRQEWVTLRPMSASTGKAYRGLNTLLLSSAAAKNGYSARHWATYRKLQELGGQVRKGEKSSPVTFWKFLERKDAETGETKRVPFLRVYSVFNVEQADWPNGMPARFEPAAVRDNDPITDAEGIVSAYVEDGPSLTYGGDRACYSVSDDAVRMPERGMFSSSEAFYAVMFHELTHSTGHPSRLDRPTITQGAPFGSPVYSREELVAELGSAMLCASVGIETPELLDNAAAYIAGWRKALADDPKAIVWAAGRAQKAADLLLDEDAEASSDGAEQAA